MLADENSPDGNADDSKSAGRKSTRMAAIRAVSGKYNSRTVSNSKSATSATEMVEFAPESSRKLPTTSLTLPYSIRSGRSPKRLEKSGTSGRTPDKPVMLSVSDLSSDTMTTSRSDIVKLLNQHQDLSTLQRKKKKKRVRVKMEDAKSDKAYPSPSFHPKINYNRRPKIMKTRPSALDLNNPVVTEKEKPKVEAQASKKKFSGIAKTAILVRSWMLSNQDNDSDEEARSRAEGAENVHENLVFEPPSLLASSNNNQPVSPRPEEPQPIVRQGGWKIIGKLIMDKLRKIAFFYVTPGSAPAYYWTLLVSVGVFYNMLAMVIFIFDDVFRGFYKPWLGANFFFDFIYLLDILIQSRTTYIFEGSEVKQTDMTTKNYLHSQRLVLDLLSLFPLDLVLFINPAISIIRMVRLFKSYRLADFAATTQKRTSFPHASKIFLLSCACYILFHWNACMYFLFSIIEGLNDYDSGAFGFNYYKVFNPVFPRCNVYEDDNCLYREENIDRANPYAERLNRSRDYLKFWAEKSVVWDMGNFSREYSMSMYWSSLTITTCGQQPYPSSSPQNLLEVVDTLIGVLVFATILGGKLIFTSFVDLLKMNIFLGVGNVVTQMNQSVYDFRMKMDAIKFYMKYRIVNVDIQDRVLQCFMYMNSQSQLTDEAEILEPLPPRLQGQIAVNLHMETLRKVELFRECDVGFLYEIVRKIKQQVYSPNDYLCKAGEKAKEMFIVKKGLLCVVRDEDDFIMETLREGATFGELSVIHIKGNKLGARRTVSLRSVGYSDVYILNQDDVTSILHEYPKDRLILLNTARSMLEARELLDKDVGEMAITGILEDETMFGILSVEEQLTRLKNIIQNVDAQINNLYTSFNDLSSNMKQRMTILESIYRTNRAEIKKDIMRNMRSVN